jgi:hypothetical protein
MELQGPKRFIRGHKGNQLDINLVATTLDNGRKFEIQALLDSGCTGSCIDSKWVKDKGITTHKYLRAIPVYNADGSMNLGGSIAEFVEL